MRYTRRDYVLRNQLIHLFILQITLDLVIGQLHYSTPEESKHGTFVGRISQDLGLEIADIKTRMLRLVHKDGKEYFQVNLQNGILFVNNIIDREDICPKIAVCVVPLEVIVDKPVQIYRVDVEIEDINDNRPVFPANEFNLIIAESRLPGTRFPLEGALDADVGINSVKTYELSSSEYFSLDVETDKHQRKSIELVLKKSIDREQTPLYNVTLTAFDGGKPRLSGTTQLLITVQDVNDNAPFFEQPLYEVNLVENAVKGTLVIQLKASDLDQGENGEIKYKFSYLVPPEVISTFSLDQHTGDIIVKGVVDYENLNLYEIQINAIDEGHNPMMGHCKILITILDVNDNPPELTVTSLSVPVPEDSSPGTVVAIISVHDKDSGVNGKVTCYINEQIPFKIKASFMEYFSLTVDGPLDREAVSQYEVIITARDGGLPSLSITKNIRVDISDVNDNAPSFQQYSHTIFITENNPPGSYVYTASADDSDLDQNSFITYSLVEDTIDGLPMSSYISVNPENGNVFALLSFDQEQVAYFQCKIKATDAGIPPLTNSLMLNVFIVDINDNSPVFTSPSLSTSGSTNNVMVPKSSKAGDLVTKVKAVDADSGYNAWLSYDFKDIKKDVEKIPFRIGHHTGEVIVTRPFEESDRQEYRLCIMAKDHGEPQMSTMVNVTFSLVETLQDGTIETIQTGRTSEDFSDANLYLIISICSISCVFLITLIAYTVIRWQKYMEELNELRKCNIFSSTTGSWTNTQQQQYNVWLNAVSKNDLVVFTPSYPQSSEREFNYQQEFIDNSTLKVRLYDTVT
ncbi:hypothetical protein FKM82_011966 [Ascaphus truei]